MADTTINFTIPQLKVPRVVAAMKGIYPIPTTTDDKTGITTNDFTDNQWAKEAVRRFIINTVARYETMEAKKLAEVDTDDTILS